MSFYADTIRSSVSMPSVCEHYGLEVNRAGFCSCPFHQERTASFKVYEDSFYCFGCHASGSVIDFVMRYFGLDFMGANEKLNDDFSLNLPIHRAPTLRDKYAARLKQNRHLMERRKLELEESNAEAAWIQADQLVESLAPTSTDCIPDGFAEALNNRDIAAYPWRQAEVRLYEFNQRHDNSGDVGTGDIP